MKKKKDTPTKPLEETVLSKKPDQNQKKIGSE